MLWYMYRTPLTPSSFIPCSSRYSWMPTRRQPAQMRSNVVLQPIKARRARHDHRLDVEIVEESRIASACCTALASRGSAYRTVLQTRVAMRKLRE
jgi:hypothetical protein